LQRRHLLARLLEHARFCDQLVDRRHVRLHPRSREALTLRKFMLARLTVPVRAAPGFAQSEIAPTTPSLCGKRFNATEDHGIGVRLSAVPSQPRSCTRIQS